MQATAHPPARAPAGAQRSRHRCHLGGVSSAASAAAPARSPLPSLPQPNTHTIRIRLAQPSDYWEASDLHCASFFEQETPQQRTRRINLRQRPPGPPTSPLGALAARDGRWMPAALRVDRCVSLQLNDDLERRGVGRTALLLAEMDVGAGGGEEELEEEHHAAPSPSSALDPLAFPRPLFFLSRLLNEPVRVGLDIALESSPSTPHRRQPTKKTLLVGAATVDSFGDLVPPRRLDPGRDGAFGWVRRGSTEPGQQYAYLSNVCVDPRARRRGVAKMLVQAAEELAAGRAEGGVASSDCDADNAAAPPWSCRAAVLHCSPSNEPALRLYASLGYRRVALEPAWSPYTSGRGAGGRCLLMVRPLGKGRRRSES